MSASEKKALTAKIESLEDKLEKALAENEHLLKELEDTLRSLKRQAAPVLEKPTEGGSETTRTQAGPSIWCPRFAADSHASEPSSSCAENSTARRADRRITNGRVAHYHRLQF